MKPSIALEKYRQTIQHVVRSHHGTNPRIFGSVLYGNDSEDSDLDLLIDPLPETSLLDIARIQVELEKHLGVPIDVLTPGSLPPKIREHVLRQARPL